MPGLLANFKDFDGVGLDTSKQQGAFAKITAKTKTSNSNLSYNHKNYVSAYKTINNLLTLSEYNVESPIYGLKRQTSMTSLDSLLSNSASFLDNAGKARFLESRSGATKSAVAAPKVSQQPNAVLESEVSDHNFVNLNEYSNLLSNQAQTNYIGANKSSSSFVKSISKSAGVLESSHSTSFLTGTVGKDSTSTPLTSLNSQTFNPSAPNARSDDASFLQSEQSTRAYTDLSVNKSNINLSSSESPLTAYFTNQLNTPQAANLISSTDNVSFNGDNFEITPSLKMDHSMTSNLLQKRATLGFPRTPFVSNNLYADALNFDKT